MTTNNNNSIKNTPPPSAAAAAHDNFKLYLKDTSEITAFALLFFGGQLTYDKNTGILSIDQSIR